MFDLSFVTLQLHLSCSMNEAVTILEVGDRHVALSGRCKQVFFLELDVCQERIVADAFQNLK